MPDTLENLSGTPVLVCAPDGPPLRGEGDANDLIGQCYGTDVTWVALPVERLPDDFFRLRTGIAGGVIQKFANYRLGLAVVGDISRHLENGTALRDLVREANRGGHLWFVPDLDTLRFRLAQG